MKRLLSLLLLPAIVLARRLNWIGYTVDPTLLPRRCFANQEVSFARCPGCGNDGRLIVGGKIMAQLWNHDRALKMLADWGHTLSVAQYAYLYRQVMEAQWMTGYFTMVPLPSVEPSFADVNNAVVDSLRIREQIDNLARV